MRLPADLPDCPLWIRSAITKAQSGNTASGRAIRRSDMRRMIDRLTTLKSAINAQPATRPFASVLAASVLRASSYAVITSAAPVSKYARHAALVSARSIAGAVALPSGGVTGVLSRLLPGTTAQKPSGAADAAAATIATDKA